MKVIVSGGGTGGHIFPAIAIAGALREIDPTVELLFVGAEGKMEMEKVPAAGYDIVGLPVAGFHRQLNLRNIGRNLLFPFKLLSSLVKAGRVLADFKPDICVGVGGYASGPVLYRAARKGIPCLIQEQNSFPGVTNKMLAGRAAKICVAYPNMERFFPKEKIVLTGNPVRQSLTAAVTRSEAAQEFHLDAARPVVLVIGGSLGARSINEGIMASLHDLPTSAQLLWQTGGLYFEELSRRFAQQPRPGVVVVDFIKRMDLAYALADVVISRAGAGSISELALLGKAAILVPSPNVSEDHQTKNARALATQKAAILVPDNEADQLLKVCARTLADQRTLAELRDNIVSFARPNAAADIARELITLVKHNNTL